MEMEDEHAVGLIKARRTRLVQTGGGDDCLVGGMEEVSGGVNTNCRGCADRLDIKTAANRVRDLPRDLSATSSSNRFNDKFRKRVQQCSDLCPTPL